MTTNATTTVTVAKYRQATDHLYRLANVDYCACVGERERANWRATAERMLREYQVMTCPRAKAIDEAHYRAAVGAVQARMRLVPPKEPEQTDEEKNLRAIWTEQGVPVERQDALIAEVFALAAPGARIGPFTL